MEHLNESILGCEEAITNAIRKLGIGAMGIDEQATRREALEQLSIALQCLNTGEEAIRVDLLETSPTAADMARFHKKQALKRSLIGPGEVLVEESFLLKALEAVESILEMAPHVRQEGDGGPSLEDEASRAFSALRAALRCGVRAIVEDLDTSDSAKLEAAQ